MKDKKIIKTLSNFLEFRTTIIDSIIPKEAKQHFLSSKKEALSGVGILIQHAIDKIDEQTLENRHRNECTNRSINITE